MADRSEKLRALAAVLDQLRPDPDARVGYDLFAGGLAWSDETPARTTAIGPELVQVQALRPVWRYRSTVIAGAPDERHRAAWDLAKALFPNWPGFLAGRSDPKWQPLLAELEAKAMDGWEALGARTTLDGEPATAEPDAAHEVP